LKIKTIETSFNLNGQEVQAWVDQDQTLMGFLRDQLTFTGTKNGCGTGHCGTCTVIVNGKATRACLVRMAKIIPGSKIETIEGLAKGDELHPLQIMFIKYGAIQCGYCIPGMIMSAKALLDEKPIRTDDEIKTHLTKNTN
jgi:aerobic-type carbon monoxide dehydrogenase small subunit (CoxS/CutS family)